VWADERVYYPVHAVPYTPAEAARALAWHGPEDPGDWQPVTRTSRDGARRDLVGRRRHLGGWGPDGIRRLVAVTADPATLPDKTTWYLVTNLPAPAASARPAARIQRPTLTNYR
jgi:hypothetical protein